MSVSSNDTDGELVVAIGFSSDASLQDAPHPSGAHKKQRGELLVGVLALETVKVLSTLAEQAARSRLTGREVSNPLNRPAVRRIGLTCPVDVPPASGFKHDERIRRRLFAQKRPRNRLDFIGNIGSGELRTMHEVEVDWNLVDRDV
ncbi:hypothetical protein JK354_19565 [Haloferax volcanii]|uniref:Uncharacterized protein n=1 Tax=Haloferax volcanii TaxID=2246 RepID=A0A8T5CIY8_HALVO|nr:hypothetical protein [Haloferax volcanii]